MIIGPVTLSGVGSSSSLRLPMRNANLEPLTIQVNFSGGGPAVATATVQVTNDPNANPDFIINNPSAYATARWNSHPILVNITGDGFDNIIYPVAYARLTLNSWTSGTVWMAIGIQDPLA